MGDEHGAHGGDGGLLPRHLDEVVAHCDALEHRVAVAVAAAEVRQGVWDARADVRHHGEHGEHGGDGGEERQDGGVAAAQAYGRTLKLNANVEAVTSGGGGLGGGLGAGGLRGVEKADLEQLRISYVKRSRRRCQHGFFILSICNALPRCVGGARRSRGGSRRGAAAAAAISVVFSPASPLLFKEPMAPDCLLMLVLARGGGAGRSRSEHARCCRTAVVLTALRADVAATRRRTALGRGRKWTTEVKWGLCAVAGDRWGLGLGGSNQT